MRDQASGGGEIWRRRGRERVGVRMGWGFEEYKTEQQEGGYVGDDDVGGADVGQGG